LSVQQLNPPSSSLEMYTQWISEYFQLPDTRSVRWGHAVNSIDSLRALCAPLDLGVSQSGPESPQEVAERSRLRREVHMLEVDVRVKQTSMDPDSDRQRTREVVLAHDPDEPGTPFELWLGEFVSYLEKDSSLRLGLKLDFKQPDAILPCLEVLGMYTELLSSRCIPLWLNADVETGYGGFSGATAATTTNQQYHSLVSFLSTCADWVVHRGGGKFGGPQGPILSLGWRTRNPHRFSIIVREVGKPTESRESKFDEGDGSIVAPTKGTFPVVTVKEAPYSATAVVGLLGAVFGKGSGAFEGYAPAHVTLALRCAFISPSTEDLLNALSSLKLPRGAVSLTLWQNAGDVWDQDALEQALRQFEAAGVDVFLDLD